MARGSSASDTSFFMKLRTPPWPTAVALTLIALALAWLIRADLAHARWVADLSSQGSPPPAADANSPTGYALGQRQFLGLHERGETYRWIAAAQPFAAQGTLPAPVYEFDTVPTGRPQLLPRLYLGWLGAVASGISIFTGEPPARATELAAFYESTLAHLALFLGATIFMARRFGVGSAAMVAVFVAFFPPLGGQFIAGVLTARTCAMLLAATSLALHFRPSSGSHPNRGFGISAAAVAGLALWLDPSFGFPAVLIAAAVGAGMIFSAPTSISFLRWSLVGAGVVLAGWLIDRSPWSPAAGELRYVHPLYVAAWLGLGLSLDAVQGIRSGSSRRKLAYAELAGGLGLVASLIVVQFRNDYAGWLYPSAAMRRLTSLDESVAFDSLFSWIAAVPPAVALLTCAPVLAAITLVAVGRLPANHADATARTSRWTALILLGGVTLFACLRVRWMVVASLVSLPAVWVFLPPRRLVRLWLLGGFAVVFAGLTLATTTPSSAWRRPAGNADPSAADLETMVYRHFSHWLASHNPGRRVAALAPPELSDAVVFHGGEKVLLSTAWESYPGQVAASRILSAPESSEAEAVIQSRELTHVILVSWDRALPFLVQTPKNAEQDTLHSRLQRWILPPYLRAMPYRLPSIASFADQKLVVFKVTAPQDEALALARLAEYFQEMDRSEPAALAARVLAESYAEDPNAAIARAIVAAAAKNPTALEAEVSRLATEASSDSASLPWDRRVQRAIVLALAHRTTLAQREIASCIGDAQRDDLFELTPLQAYRLKVLMKRFAVTFQDPALETTLTSLGAEYRPNAAPAR